MWNPKRRAKSQMKYENKSKYYVQSNFQGAFDCFYEKFRQFATLNDEPVRSIVTNFLKIEFLEVTSRCFGGFTD